MGHGGEGVEARKNSIRILFTIPGQGRQRHTLTLDDGTPIPPTPANLRYAAKVVDNIRSRIRAGIFSPSDIPGYRSESASSDIKSQLEMWLNTQRIAESTRAGYESAIRFWAATIGAEKVESLKTSQILLALATKQKLSGKTINNYVSVLREAMSLAVTDKIIAANPVDGVPRAAHQKEPPDPFSRDEMDNILAWMARHAPEQVANLVAFWAWTGLRTSEIAALKWPSVDLRRGEAEIHEALVRGKKKATTKTSVSRIVRLNSRAMAALEAQRQHTQLVGSYVFTDPRYGTAWHEERAFRRSYWEPCLKVLGIRYRRPYNMRHSYATRMLEARMTPAYCAKQLGHSVEMFLNTYARWIDGERDDLEMSRLESSLSPVLSPESAGR